MREGKDKGKTHVTVWQASRELVRLYFLSLVIRDTALILIFIFVITFRHYMKKEMATHSSILSWKIPWIEEPGKLQSMGWQKVRHN